MTPQEPHSEIKEYRPKLSVETRDALMDLASALAFVINQPGRYDGVASVRDFLEALAAAYRRDPMAVRDALRGVGVIWRPEPEDAE